MTHRDEFQALLRSRYLNLETFRRNGTGVRTPVWFAHDSGTTRPDGRAALYVYSNQRTGKLKRLRHTARVRIARCSIGGTLKGRWFETRARVLDDPIEQQHALGVLQKRYGLLMRLAGWAAAVVGRLGERRVIRIEMPIV
ncbi:MAG: PPOX class F420-dependent oxidoreductase [Gammaproteobacteria bacterium]|nr:PPOX class F420-dependent oxidoreductase [Gammaproteobacteria bacterium]